MTHPQQTIKSTQSAFNRGLAAAMVLGLYLSGLVPIASGYNGDATQAITGLATHSSFHYEMVRVLAALAGFSKDEAEEIAVAGEAVDLGTFTGYKISGGAKTVTVKNTNRFGPNGLLYHFARRSSEYEKAEAAGSVGNTCEYFKNGNPNRKYTAPCTNEGPELDWIRNWAFALPGPKPTASQLPLDKSGKPVQPRTLVALGIYVHSIGDSYSHEKCMIDQSFRFHKPNPFCCNANWHTDPRGDFGEGVPFTQAAANEVWRALRQYKGADGSNVPLFATEFIGTRDACLRVKFAVDTFNRLANETTVIKCATTP
ncbi:MAG TPA: DUF6765 family protein [Blastocatellia bacterium]|nr:DUF6765 family protein [Blastocatellia bacterium]